MGSTALTMTDVHELSGSTAVRGLVNLGFLLGARLRVSELAELDPVRTQASVLRRLIRRASRTVFGQDHGFDRIDTVADFQAAVPIRTYEDLWNAYLRERYPVFEDLTWPGRIPFLALTSGTTQGATKYIPVSKEMVTANRKAAQTMLAFHLRSHPHSRLFHGRLFFLGGSTDLEQPAPGIYQGDLSGIASLTLSPLLRPYTFPPLAMALERDWDRKLSVLAERSPAERITLVSGVPSWLIMLFQRVLDWSGKKTISDVWPPGTGGPRRRQIRPLSRDVPIDPWLVGNPAPGKLSVLGGIPRFRRFGDRLASAGGRSGRVLRIRAGRRARLASTDSSLARNGPDWGELRDRGFDVRRDVGSSDRRHHSIRIA